MSVITRCDMCGYEINNNNIPVFGFTGKCWQKLHNGNGFQYDLCCLECVSKWIQKNKDLT